MRNKTMRDARTYAIRGDSYDADGEVAAVLKAYPMSPQKFPVYL
jgi:hypothetical protein